MRIPPLRRVLSVALSGAGLIAIGGPLQAQDGNSLRTLRQAVELREQANQRGSEVQKRIVTLSEETDALYTRHQNALAQLESLRKFNQGMREVISEQESQIADLDHQLDQVDEVARRVTPLMYEMIDTLDEFVSLDIPFLAEERAERVQSLRRLMGRADVTVSEKYRRIMEAYQIETEYGRTIEAYRAPLGESGETVDFLRFGRIALVWLSLDGQRAGAWDPRARDWMELPASHVSDVQEGLRVARKQIAPDLVPLPLMPEGEG